MWWKVRSGLDEANDGLAVGENATASVRRRISLSRSRGYRADHCQGSGGGSEGHDVVGVQRCQTARLSELEPHAAVDHRCRQVSGAFRNDLSGVRRAVQEPILPFGPRVVLATCSFTGRAADLRQEGRCPEVLGAQHSVAPIVAALIEDIVDEARRQAAKSDSRRLESALHLMLDECANIAPLGDLLKLVAELGGLGIITEVVLQSVASARKVWRSVIRPISRWPGTASAAGQ